jgi:hypothetical protein
MAHYLKIPSETHLLGPNSHHHNFQLRLHRSPKLLNEPNGRRLHHHSKGPLHLPRHQAIPHRRRSLGGKGGQYSAILVGFPVGFLLQFVVYYAQKKFPRQKWLRQTHAVVVMYGATTWAPYNGSYTWPAVPIGWLSMVFLDKRFLAFWSELCSFCTVTSDKEMIRC